MDNYAAHKHPKVNAWLAAHPTRDLPFHPDPRASWMNLVEFWFSLIERQAIHRGTDGSVSDLNAKIRALIDGWNDRCHPFVWTNTADQILNKANPKQTSNAGTNGGSRRLGIASRTRFAISVSSFSIMSKAPCRSRPTTAPSCTPMDCAAYWTLIHGRVEVDEVAGYAARCESRRSNSHRDQCWVSSGSARSPKMARLFASTSGRQKLIEK